MPKTWIQFNDASGGYVEWPENTLPSKESIFRARFLSQFTAWIKYLSAIEGTDPQLSFACGNPNCGEDHSHVYPGSATGGDYRHYGTVIQSAEFWNMLDWRPSSKWILIHEDELEVGNQLSELVKVVDSDEYDDTLFGGVSVGDNLQAILPSLILKLRKRIDLCVAAEAEIFRHGPISIYTYSNWWGVPGNDPYEYSDYHYGQTGTWNGAAIPPGFTGAMAAWNIVSGFSGWYFSSSRNVGIQRPATLPELAAYSAMLCWTDQFPGNSPQIPFSETVLPARKIEAIQAQPVADDVFLIGSAYETITGANYSSGDGAVFLNRSGLVIPFDEPFSEFLPRNELFNDLSGFSGLYV